MNYYKKRTCTQFFDFLKKVSILFGNINSALDSESTRGHTD